ncbi:MAG TPA: ComF family protein [Dehalococcoidia bacterium]|nr:ComF family protein [Dehalococcoidia bacterium]
MSPQLSLQKVKTALLDILLPLRCVGCGKEGSLICPSCSDSLPRVKLPLCQRCGTTVNEGNLCSACLSHPLAINGIRSAFLFQGVARQAILQFKYRQLKALAAPLAQLLAEYLHSHPMIGEVLVPVPLHPKRLRQRGYNQASLLAKELSKIVGLPVEEDALIRVQDVAPQARTKSATERRLNVRDAFACNKNMADKQILIIDDVCTTGATLDACAIALKTAGASSVWGLTLSREN